MKIYFIGGSPCSGKSTVAEMLIDRFAFHYFKIDDYLDRYIKRGATAKKPICLKQEQLSSDQIWMRDAHVQADEEWQFYDEIFEYIMEDIQALPNSKPIIAEGAAFKPDLMNQLGVLQDAYMCIIPSREFQVEKYEQRDWVDYVLGDCHNPKQAFQNWMERDILFAQKVRASCDQFGYTCVINDGTKSLETMEAAVIDHFRL